MGAVREAEILVVGAGPTGLTMAVELHLLCDRRASAHALTSLAWFGR
jgi:NADH dehydrogenase FAD-containing subunit